MKKLSTKIITILALCIALNIVGSNIALLLKLLIYLDTIGTILAASLAGPVGGVTVGALTSIIVGLTTDLFSLYYLPVQLIVGLVAGMVYSHYAADTFKKLWWLAIIISLPATLVSSAITLFLFHSITSSGSAIIVQILAKLGLGKGLAVFLVQVGTDYLDRLVAIYVVSLVYKALKSRISLGVTKY